LLIHALLILQSNAKRTSKLLNKAAAAVMKRGHIPVIGVNVALPVVEWLDPESGRV
jgi:hypothetical protein